MAQKITHYLLITLILSLGFGQLLRFEFLGLPIYLHDILTLVILCLLFPRSVLKRNSWLQAKKGSTAVERTDLYVILGLKIFLAGLALGYLRALTLYPLSDLLIPSLYTIRLLAYLTLYFVLKNSKLLVSKIYFLTSGSIALIIGLGQYFLLPDMRVFQYLGWDDHLSRLTLPHFDPTFTAVMLGLAFLSLSRYLLPTIYYLPAILLTYSRSVWLSLVFTLFLFYKKSKLFLIFIFVFLICITFWLPKKFGEGTNLLRTYSITSRITSDLAVVKKSGWNLVVGQGMNTFPRNSINNSYLYLLATTGVLGLVGWGMFMSSLYKKSTHKPMLIFFFIASLFNNVMFYPFSLLWVLLIETQQNKFDNWRI